MTPQNGPQPERVVRIALAQTNTLVGDICGNLEKIRNGIRQAKEAEADLVVFPELSLIGYPPEDLLLKPRFAEHAEAALEELAADATDLVAIVGFPDLSNDLYNAAAIMAEGRLAGIYRKCFLPNYGVFDEQRYFARGDEGLVIDLGGIHIGVTICEDLWYPGGPAQWAAIDGGAAIVVNLSASPYHRSKGAQRERMFATRAVDYNCYIAFCNAVGGQDELVFDGHSLLIDPRGASVTRGRQFEEDLVIADIDPMVASRRRLHDPRWRQRLQPGHGHVSMVSVPAFSRERAPVERPALPPLLEPEAEVYRALVLGTSDYFRKNGFRRAVLGLSGGIDSALSLVVAADALGADAVTAVSMPSRYTAEMNGEDAAELVRRLGVRLIEIPIEPLVQSYTTSLATAFAGATPNVAEENIQSRVRGNLLMALSNKFGWLLITTGNKSEMSVGYATLYGDMAGGFSILKDVLKTWVYRLARWRNRHGDVIPARVIDKAPSAELREHQLDTDTLPPYDILDQILEAYVEDDRSADEIVALGFDSSLVGRVVQMVDGAEYKRRQAPPGVRISGRAFGKDRRLPITNRYKPL
jgi:NAD+ synthase (glutamine-hydrolysing)